MLISPAATSALGRHQPLHIKQTWILKRNICKIAKYLHNSTLKDKIGKNDKNLYLDRSFVTFSGWHSGTQCVAEKLPRFLTQRVHPSEKSWRSGKKGDGSVGNWEEGKLEAEVETVLGIVAARTENYQTRQKFINNNPALFAKGEFPFWRRQHSILSITTDGVDSLMQLLAISPRLVDQAPSPPVPYIPPPHLSHLTLFHACQ